MKLTKLKVTEAMKDEAAQASMESCDQELHDFIAEHKEHLKKTGLKILKEVLLATEDLGELSSLEEAVTVVKALDLFVQHQKKITSIEYGMEVVSEEEFKKAGSLEDQILAQIKEMEA